MVFTRIPLLIALAMFGCAKADHSKLSDAERLSVQDQVAPWLRDNPSAQWRWLSVSAQIAETGEGSYCGFFSTNDEGRSHVGFKQFIVWINRHHWSATTVDRLSMSDDANQAYIATMCKEQGYPTAVPTGENSI